MVRRTFVNSCNVMCRQAWPLGFGSPRLNIGRLCTKRTNHEYILVGLENVYTGGECLHALFTNASSDRCGALPEVSRADFPNGP
jgi:hypothetical protein